MNRLLLSLACSTLLATHFSASADTLAVTSQTTATPARTQLDAQRERLTGVDKVGKNTAEANTLLDTPVDTSDAPAQVDQP
ncbi:hypothetical protein PS627_00303 [Pseudomonas fluorescens]|uniref:hypothetical protein n=1 Tax=Pseudomonas fluorescens TaxID=294 RepID=UPI001256C476|nr:hypothetical protein [Pseudomonas fluorescens]CAG8863365.1 hypothetical protein PS627_00303 [Pseudomonas fluorescens]VVQ01846.1 hypothetical protein PS910_03884 [Pseudomonas fluorescens]